MNAAWAIFRKELRIYFVSPLATVFLAAFLFLAGLFFYIGVANTGDRDGLRLTASSELRPARSFPWVATPRWTATYREIRAQARAELPIGSSTVVDCGSPRDGSSGPPGASHG